MNKQEMEALREQEKDFPIRSKIFKHKETGEYETQINIFEIGDYIEMN